MRCSWRVVSVESSLIGGLPGGGCVSFRFVVFVRVVLGRLVLFRLRLLACGVVCIDILGYRHRLVGLVLG